MCGRDCSTAFSTTRTCQNRATHSRRLLTSLITSWPASKRVSREVKMRIRVSRISAVMTLMLTLHLAAHSEDKNEHGRWVSAWSTAMHTPLPFPGLPPPPIFENQTIRMVIRPTIGGERVRIGLSNIYGTAPLEVGSAHIALLDHGSTISTESDHPLTFGGQPTVSIPPGAPIL